MLSRLYSWGRENAGLRDWHPRDYQRARYGLSAYDARIMLWEGGANPIRDCNTESSPTLVTTSLMLSRHIRN